jgi:hypothetical protein
MREVVTPEIAQGQAITLAKDEELANVTIRSHLVKRMIDPFCGPIIQDIRKTESSFISSSFDHDMV